MLTGGSAAEQLYLALAVGHEFRKINGLQILFGDERCVPPDHPESNFGLVMRTLLRDGLPPSWSLLRMNAENPDPEVAAAAYEAILPESVDVLLLSMGTDGHIASLFPGSSALFQGRRRVVHVVAPKPPFERLTVTPSVIMKARHVFVMALGKDKAAVYEQAKLAPSNISELPARLVLEATWFLDTHSRI